MRARVEFFAGAARSDLQLGIRARARDVDWNKVATAFAKPSAVALGGLHHGVDAVHHGRVRRWRNGGRRRPAVLAGRGAPRPCRPALVRGGRVPASSEAAPRRCDVASSRAAPGRLRLPWRTTPMACALFPRACEVKARLALTSVPSLAWPLVIFEWGLISLLRH